MQGAQSVDRALQILDQFSRENPKWSVRELCEVLELTPPTAYRLIRALADHGLLSADPSSNRFTIGPNIVRLADIVMVPEGHGDLHTLALPRLERLRTLSGETVGVHRRVGLHRIAVAELESPQHLRLSLGTGRMRPLHTGAVGKAFMAHLSPSELSKVMRMAERAGYEVSQEELAEIRMQGYAVSISETTPGASAIAAPIVDAVGAVEAVMSISGPEQRWTRELMAATADDLLASVREISAEMHGTSGRVNWTSGKESTSC